MEKHNMERPKAAAGYGMFRPATAPSNWNPRSTREVCQVQKHGMPPNALVHVEGYMLDQVLYEWRSRFQQCGGWGPVGLNAVTGGTAAVGLVPAVPMRMTLLLSFPVPVRPASLVPLPRISDDLN